MMSRPFLCRLCETIYCLFAASMRHFNSPIAPGYFGKWDFRPLEVKNDEILFFNTLFTAAHLSIMIDSIREYKENIKNIKRIVI